MIDSRYHVVPLVAVFIDTLSPRGSTGVLQGSDVAVVDPRGSDAAPGGFPARLGTR